MMTLRHMLTQIDKFSRLVRRDSHYQGTDVEWSKTYILALVREAMEMLDTLPWKPHRGAPNRSIDIDHLIDESVDVLNYTLATLSLLGVEPERLEQVWEDKLEVLRQRRYQEVVEPLQPHDDIVVLDLDGCIADFRGGFLQWLKDHPEWGQTARNWVDDERSLHIDLNSEMYPSVYRALKEQFELASGYRTLPMFPGGRETIEAVGYQHVLVFLTSRPPTPRVWRDTLAWLRANVNRPFVLEFSEHKAVWLTRQPARVTAVVEDDPKQVARIAKEGYYVLVPARGYNEGLENRMTLPEIAKRLKELTYVELPKEL